MNNHKNDWQQLKASLRIEEVIGRYLHLQPNKKNYTGVCPFHDDHHPSLVVDPEKQTYVCYACGEHGDVFDFVRTIEHCSLQEAVGKLDTGGKQNAVSKRNTLGKQEVIDKLNAIGKLDVVGKPDANKHVERLTLLPLDKPAVKKPKEKNSEEKSSEEKDFAEKSPNEKSSAEKKQPAKDLSAFLKLLMPYSSGHSELSASYLDFEVGLSPVQVPAEWKGMRNRLIFPIRDENGQLVGMAARRLKDDCTDQPKYINSSAADGYDKGATLYGLNRAAAVIRKEDCVFITEGYKDVIAMHAAGFVNTVALCGTALTAQQIVLLKKYTNRVYLLLDADEAGRKASIKAVEHLRELKMDAESVSLPDGDDPDSLFRRIGREAFAAMIGKLQNRPHSSECALLTLCLLYPEATYQLKGETYRFIDLAASAMETDILWFEDEDHRCIFDHLLQEGTGEGLPDSLQQVANELHEEYDAALLADLQRVSLVVYLPYLLFMYSEARLLRLIGSLIRQVCRTDNVEQQHKLVTTLAQRREQLRHVAVWLGRPGAY